MPSERSKSLALILGAAICMACAPAPSAQTAETDLAGVWLLDEALSDDPGQVRRAVRRQRLAAGAGQEGTGVEAADDTAGAPGTGERRRRRRPPAESDRGDSEAAEGEGDARPRRRRPPAGEEQDNTGAGELVITQTGSSVTLSYGNGREIEVVTDGEPKAVETRWGEATLTSTWEEGVLVIDSERASMDSTERFEVSEEGDLLTVTTTAMVAGSELTYSLVYRRVE